MTKPGPRKFAIGDLPSGSRNAITDVPGVKVGHRTVIAGEIRTGVTAVLPHSDDMFRHKVPAAVHVLNGFGKSAGLMQIDELGQIETPILLTNTLSVPACVDALISRAIAENPGIGRQTSTVNAVVGECNDGYLSDIQARAITPADADAALEAASADFARGAVGAGTGMSAFGFKGGVGTASRRLTFDGADYHMGALVLSNFGRAGDLRLPDGTRAIPPAAPSTAPPERGSIIIVIGLDIPLDHRQLQRVIRRSCHAAIVDSRKSDGDGRPFGVWSPCARCRAATPSRARHSSRTLTRRMAIRQIGRPSLS